MLLDIVGADSVAYSDTTVVPETTYYYRVQAYNGSGPSDYSNVASETTPSGLTLSSVVGYKVRGVNKVDLTWSNSSAITFDIYRDGNPIALDVADTTFTDTLSSKGTYSYQVCEANSVTVCSNIVDIDM